MNHQPDHTQQHVRRVMLPSGKMIEVVYYDAYEIEPSPFPPEPAHDPAAELTHCGSCESNLVYPVDWAEAGAGHWEVDLRCPNCEWTGTGVYEQEVVDRLDLELDRGTEELLEDLQALTRANMEEQVDRFVAALDQEHILPEDF